jgi:hypothetical protein
MHLKAAPHNLQKQPVYDQLYKDYQLYISDSVLIFFSKKYAICRKNTKRIDQAALPLASIMVTLRVYKMGSDIVT